MLTVDVPYHVAVAIEEFQRCTAALQFNKLFADDSYYLLWYVDLRSWYAFNYQVIEDFL